MSKIRKLLCRNGRLSVCEVVSALGTSEATVRRYFTIMEGNGELVRTYGGVCLPSFAGNYDYHFNVKSSSNTVEKRQIGLAAARLISSHDRLFFDSGTTVYECENNLANFLIQGIIEDIIVCTNSLVYSEELAKSCRFNMLGGTLRVQRMDVCGMSTIANIRKHNFSKALLGADGISAEGQLFTTDEDTSLLAEAAIEQSKEVFVLADSTKLGQSSFSAYGSLCNSRFTLITDDKVDKALIENYKALGIEVKIASERQ